MEYKYKLDTDGTIEFYDVVAMDPSPAMCAKTKEIANVPVFLMKAEELSFKKVFLHE